MARIKVGNVELNMGSEELFWLMYFIFILALIFSK